MEVDESQAMNDLFRGLGRVCLGSLACAALSAASFFGIEALMPSEATADSWGVSHSCSEPYDRSDEYDVESFRDCIEDFVDEQKDAIKRHADAADEAIDDWNDFANGW